MTNFNIYFWDEQRDPIAVAHANRFADAVAISESLPNSDIIDAETGEILRMRWHHEIVWAV